MGKKPKARSPSERFTQIFNIIENIADAIGANVFRDPYHFSFMSYALITFIVTYFLCTIYTSYVAIAIENDWGLVLQSVSITGTAVQGVAKLSSAVVQNHNFRFLRNEIGGLYAKYECQNVKYQQLLTKSLLLIKRITFTLVTIYGIAIIGLICLPLYFRYIKDERILILPLFFPGIDQTSHWGYMIHQVVHVIGVIFAMFGGFASDMTLFILVAHIPLMKNILKCKFDDLDQILQIHPRDDTKSGPPLKDIFQFHQKYIHFSSLATKTFFWVIFVQIGTATASIICGIICQFLGIMPSGPVYLVYSFMILYIYSGLGNLVEISNDAVTIDIYDSSWYLLTVPEQKMILIMLRESQTTEGISIGGISPLSLNAALQITKTIYTVAMLINGFLN